MRDIQSKEDIAKVIDSFYEKLLADTRISHLFTEHQGEHLAPHLEKVVAFWDFLLFGKEGYDENVMAKHKPLALEAPHFEIWTNYFNEAIKQHFQGTKADEAISRANSIAQIMKMKLLS